MEDQIYNKFQMLINNSVTPSHIVSIQDEANRYTALCFDGRLHTVDKTFLHELINA